MIENIRKLAELDMQATVERIEALPQSGSDRRYFRLYTPHKTFIACHGNNIRENKTFISFSRHFLQQGAPVPKVFAANHLDDTYIVEDFGDESLLNRLESEGYSDHVYALFKKSLQQLARMQVIGGEGIDYEMCLTAKEFGKQAILSDLLYFKYYFLDTLKFPYDKQLLLDEFEALSTYLTHSGGKHFMFRDFQSRNVMIQHDEVHFIDYQGGMKGALQYDVASMLWQAKADLPQEWKESLLKDYIEAVNKVLDQPVDPDMFRAQYNGYVLIRMMQVLGAYGFRGFFQRKAHFLISIPLALRNLKFFLEQNRMGITVPEFEECLQFCVSEEVIKRFEPVKVTEESPLVVRINSFSYRKGIPADASANGGGFVFDCRGILNPGRIEEFKQATGRDQKVKDYLEQQTEMPAFLNSVFDVVDISVTDYIKRKFSDLMISFGCTGGQHRSVYAAEALSRHLRNKFGARIILNHREQLITERKGF